MTWAGFLALLAKASSVTLVGPLHDTPVTPDEPTIFVDGGSQFRVKVEKFPTISVGDGDSGSTLDVTLSPEKDFSDLAFVLRELPRQVVKAQLLGFLGGRLDHELANLGELQQFLLDRPRGARVEMRRSGRAEVIGFTGSATLDIQGLFSVIVLEASVVTISGECRYKLSGGDPLVPGSSHGLSNIGRGRVTVASDGPCFIFLIADA